MRLILLILSLLIFSCELWSPIIEGCTTSTACNYNPEAKEDDNSCIDPLGCDNWCPDDTTEVKELDCAGICGGVQFIDCSGQCGILVLDECGVCGGNNTICKDCNGVINGEAELDNCLDCVGGDTGMEACTYDCTGIWGGNAEFDECGVCNGIINYVSGTCNDCDGIPNGTAYTDGCGECVGGNTTLDACSTDCADVFGGTSFYDNCGECVSEGDTTCIQGCDGIWVNDGTHLVLDECDVCDGDNTVCAGCDGIPNSGLEIDVCGVCGGDGTCLPEHCTDDNESGYCQDLSVLQILIDNSSGTLSMYMDENGNGVIEPLELGNQEWLDGRLTFLYCYNDGLSGEIPLEIGNLTNLTSLYLHGNELTGEIPPEIGNLTNLTYLNLLNNQLTGEIPPEIGNLTKLEGLRIEAQMTGSIPTEIGNLVNLRYLWLNNNQLSGEIPSSIGNLVNINDLFLYENELTGQIPIEIGNMVNLKRLHIGANKLSGAIPENICDIYTNFTEFNISNNNLCPPYPSCIEDYVGEQDTSECEEPLCDEGYVELWGECYNIETTTYLNLNGLTGEIPAEIGNLTNLEFLYLTNNQLTGKIPVEIGNLTSLTYLYLWNNQFTGEIPSEIGNLTNLTNLDLAINQFTGEIPSEIGSLTNLTSLKLWDNQLTGEIPSEIGNLTNLTSLTLYSNQLEGEIPSEIGNLTNLTNLSLNSNQLRGEIPSEIGNLTNLTYLNLSNNQLTGEIPIEICNQGDSSPDLTNNNLCRSYPSCIEDSVGEQDCLIEDVDGNTYEIVHIGDQIWMAENLKVTHYNNGDEIPTGYSNSEWVVLETGAYAMYDDDPANADIYGNLYNWYAVGGDDLIPDDRNLCMDGWHVPSDEEWMELEMFLGMSEEEANSSGFRGTDEGSKLAENSDLWYGFDLVSNSEFGTSGFNGLPAGYRSHSIGTYYGMDGSGLFWSSSESISNSAWARLLDSIFSGVYRYDYGKRYGFSIRCLAD